MKKSSLIFTLLFLIAFTTISCGKGEKLASLSLFIVALNTGDTINSIEVDKSVSLNAIAVYNDASEVNVAQSAQWASSNTTVATVDDNGILYAHQPGLVTITLSFAEFTRQIVINVLPKIVKLEFIHETPIEDVRFEQGDEINLGLIAICSGDTRLDVLRKASWKSSDTDIAKIEAAGRIKGISSGEVTISANFRDISATLDLSVVGPINNTITALLNSLELDQTIQLDVSLTFSDGIEKTITENLNWDYDKYFVKIDNNNLLTTINSGTTKISAIYKGTQFDYEVIINPYLDLFLTSDSVKKTELSWNKRAPNKFTLYRKSNASISVDDNGKITINQDLEIIDLPESSNIYDELTQKNSYTFTNLDRNTDYYFRIEAIINGELQLSNNQLKVRPRINQWHSNPFPSEQSEQRGGLMLDGQFYTLGGQQTIEEKTNYRDNLSYNNLSTRQNFLLSGLKFPTSNMAVCADNNYIYLLGGRILTTTNVGTEENPIKEEVVETSSQNERYDLSSNSWASVKAMPVALEGHQCAIFNKEIYVFGGHNETDVSNSIHIYNIANQEWTTTATPMTSARTEFSLASNEGVFYLSGGKTNTDTFVDTFESYDPELEQWTSLNGLPLSLAHHSSVFHANKLYVTGGETDANNSSSEVFVYEDSDKLWSTLGNLSTKRSRHDSFIHNSKLYIIAGLDLTAGTPVYTEKTEIYDLEKSSWLITEPPPINAKTIGPISASTTAGNKIYLIHAINDDESEHEIITFNTTSNAWLQTGLSLSNKKYPKAITVNNRIYVFTEANFVTTMQSFDPTQETFHWELEKNGPPENARFSSITTAGDNIYLTGGFPNEQAHAFNTVSKTWSTTSLQSMPRGNNSTAITLGDFIYVMGGRIGNSTNATNSVERYNRTSDQWEIVTPMQRRRASASSKVINGKIYVFGGESSEVLSSVEAFDPLTNTWTEITDMPRKRAGMSSEMMNDMIYFFGGFTEAGGEQTSLSTIDIFR